MLCGTVILLLASSLAVVPATQLGDSVVTGEARSADGVKIRYTVRGTGEPTLVLLHGWTNGSGIWGEHPKTLSPTHRVVTVDLAGHGESGDGRAEWTMEAFGDDVIAVVEQLRLERVVLVGFSMGAAVAVAAAEQLGDRLQGIVFVDSFHDPEYRLSDAEAEQMLGAFRANWGDTAFVRAFAFTPDAPDSLIQYVARAMPEQPREHWFTIFAAVREWTESELGPALRRIDVPVAAINTTAHPTNVTAMRGYVPSFTVDTLSGVGHAGILLQRVEDFDALLLAIVARWESAAPR